MTPADDQLLQQFLIEGTPAFTSHGLSETDMLEFFDRADVKMAMQAHLDDFKNQETIEALSRFTTKRQLSRFSGGAVAVLAQALAGPVYKRDETTGNVIGDQNGHPVALQPEPTKNQIVAARDILDRLGVEADGRFMMARRHDVSVGVLLHVKGDVAVELDYDPDLEAPEELAASRERMRHAMLGLRSKVAAGHAMTRAALGLSLKKGSA